MTEWGEKTINKEIAQLKVTMMWHLVLRTGVTQGGDEHSGIFFCSFLHIPSTTHTHAGSTFSQYSQEMPCCTCERPFICNNCQDCAVPQGCPAGIMSHSITQKPNARDQKTAVSGHAIDWHLLLGIMKKWNLARETEEEGRKLHLWETITFKGKLGDSTPNSHSGRQKKTSLWLSDYLSEGWRRLWCY